MPTAIAASSKPYGNACAATGDLPNPSAQALHRTAAQIAVVGASGRPLVGPASSLCATESGNPIGQLSSRHRTAVKASKRCSAMHPLQSTAKNRLVRGNAALGQPVTSVEATSRSASGARRTQIASGNATSWTRLRHSIASQGANAPDARWSACGEERQGLIGGMPPAAGPARVAGSGHRKSFL